MILEFCFQLAAKPEADVGAEELWDVSVCSPGAADESSDEAPGGFVAVSQDGQCGLCAGT